MRLCVFPTSVVLAILCLSNALWAYTVTFDDVPTGQDLNPYLQQYGLDLVPGWQVMDSIASGWGTPHSGAQSAIWNGNPLFATGWGFGVDSVSEYTVRSVGAYFTTAPGVVLEMRGFPVSGTPVTVRIGDASGSWTNHYAGISSPLGNIAYVHIVGVSSPDAVYRFTMDDLAIVPVPEPSSLLALLVGFGGLSGLRALRRRRP